MSKIGILIVRNQHGLLEGAIATLEMTLELRLEPNGVADSGDDPTHDVFAMVGGRAINVGAGWTKVIKRGPSEGQRFVSFTIDDPSFAAPLNLSAFPAIKPGTFDVVWKRSRGGSAPRPAVTGPTSDISDDEIPY
jgi:uncharacterized protein (DUF736 family)